MTQETEKKDDGDAAFPQTKLDGLLYTYAGISLRDYFAAKAMQGILANPKLPDAVESMVYAASQCYGWADAMLKARKQ